MKEYQAGDESDHLKEELIASPASNLVSSHHSRSGSFVSKISRYLNFLLLNISHLSGGDILYVKS